MKSLSRPNHRSMRFAASILLLAVACPQPASAEGTRTLHPAGALGNRGVMDVSNSSNFANVARGRQFLYVHARAGEYLLLGSRNRSNGGDIFVYNPQSFGTPGDETIPAAADFTCSSQAGGTIASRAQELAGPNSADGSATVTDGFTPCWYVAPTTGTYGVRFSGATSGAQTNSASIATPPILGGELVSAWDITVRAGADSLADINGRVFTYAWTVYLNSNGRQLYNDLYYVSSDGYRYKQTFRGLDPNRAAFYANAAGFLDSDGGPLYRDLRGANAAVTSGPSFSAGITAQRPQYPIFFSDVSQSGANAAEVARVLAALAIPLVPAQPQLSSPSFVGNVGGNTSTEAAGGVFTFTTLNTLTYEIVVSRDGVDYDPANALNRVLTGTALSGNHTVLWDGLDNGGNAFPAGSYDFRIVGRNGEIHFPMIDVEANLEGGPTLTKLNGFALDTTTVYYDDRGYRAANNTTIGTLDGHLCGAASLVTQPVPTHSLVGVDSADANLAGSGNYFRSWNGSADDNSDCRDRVTEYFGTAKGLDLWALERSPVLQEPIVIVPPTVGVDVGTQVSVTPSVLAGETAYGSFVFSNAGDTAANGATYAVTLGNPAVPATCPASVNFTLLPPGVTANYNAAPLCTITFTGMPTTLAPEQSLSFNFNYVVAVANPGPIPIATSIAASNENNDVAPNAASAQTVVARPIITVAKSANPASGTAVDIGDSIEYTVSVAIANAPLSATFTLQDTLSASLTFGTVVSASPAFNCSGTLTCTLPAGTATGTYSVTYSATVAATATGSVSNNVLPSGGGGENPPSCSPSCTTTHPVNAPDLTITKTGPATAVVGVAYDYTVTVTNEGSADATASATVSDSVPAGLTINSAGPGCTIAAQVVTCSIAQGDLQIGESVAITINVTPTVAAGASVSNSAGVTGGGDPDCVDAADCDTPPVVTTIAAPQVSVNKSADPADGAPVAAGDTITYTLSVAVTGAPTTAALLLTDTLDAQLGNFQLVANSGGFVLGGAGNVRSFTLPAGSAIGTYLVSYSADVLASASGAVGNNVAIDPSNDGGDPDPGCNDCSTTHPLASNVSLTKTLSDEGNAPANGIASPGETLTYSITLGNSGGVAATGYSVTDALDANVVFVSADNGGAHAAGAVTWTGLTVPASGSLVLTVTVQVVDPLPAGVTRIVNLAYPTGGTVPPCPGSGCVQTPVPVVPQLTMVKDATLNDVNSNSFADANETIDYSLTATNTGNIALSGVAIADPRLPTLACTPAQPANLAIGAPLTCTGSYSVTQSDVDAGAAIVNTATATAPDPTDPDPMNPTLPPLEESDTTSTPVSAQPALEVTKLATLNDGNGNGTGDVDETIGYAVSVRNIGNVTLSALAVSDSLAGATPVALTCAPTTLAPNQTATCDPYSHVITLAEASAGGALVNVATATANPPSGTPVTDTDDASTPLGEVIADLAIQKTGPANGTIGAPVTFTIVVRNLGPHTAVNTVLTDPTPAGLQFVSNAGDCGTAFPCALGDLAINQTRTVQSTFLVPPGYSGPTTIINIASVTSDSQDPTPGGTSSSASTVVGSGVGPNAPAVIPASSNRLLLMLAALMLLMAAGALRRD
jgi:uncharacterized repeat protein (TIGR01451 family)/fimbrial isopeptide formation D2 family protein